MASLTAPSTTAPTATRRISLNRALVLASAAIALGTVGYVFAEMVGYERQPVFIAGAEVPPGAEGEAFVRGLARDWHDTELSIDTGARFERVTRRELGATLATDDAIEELRLARGDAPIWERAAAFAEGRSRRLRWTLGVDTEALREQLERVAERTDEAAVPVRRDGTGGRAGVSISVLGATSTVTEALQTDSLFVRLPVRRHAAPRQVVRDLRHARFDQVVAAHETRYVSRGELSGRAQNIYLAARFLDGSVIDPNGTLSFNGTVGERSFERGFAPATELGRGGRRTEGIGGGVCQVAATLHAAAFFGGLDIQEHHPHTRNSSYIAVGLDSAVSWPNKDLVIHNPHPFHVRVRANAQHGRLRIELLGQARGPRVEWNTRTLSRIRRSTVREVSNTMSPGSEDVTDEGEDGSIVERTRTVYWSDGPVTESTRLRYPVVNRLVQAGAAL